MRKAVLALLVTIISSLAFAQDHGLVGGVVNFQVRVLYWRPGTRTVDSEIPRPMQVSITKVYTVMPAPYRMRLFEWQLISQAEARSLGVSQSSIDSLQAQQDRLAELYGPPYGEISFVKGYTGTYVGQIRRTVGTIGTGQMYPGEDPVTGIEYSRKFRDRIGSYGWTGRWHLEDTAVSSALFNGPGAPVASSGVDLVFYAGHGNSNGPAHPGCSPDQYYWGDLANQNRGLRWMVTQSCNWFPNMDGPYSMNGPWAKAMKQGNGSMHAIFGYASTAWLWPSFTFDLRRPITNSRVVEDTDLAPVAFIDNVLRYGGQNGPSWVLGSQNQRSSMRSVNQTWALGLVSNDFGQAPSVLSVKNWYGDYYYESLQSPWPDPVDLDDPSPSLVLHTTIVGSPKW